MTRAAAGLCVALAAAGLLRDVSVHLWKEGYPFQSSSPLPRFEPLRALLPLDARVGYLTDAPDELKTYFEALYSLAPRVVLRGAEGLTVADFSDARKLDDFARARGLRVVKRFDNGTALLSRAP